MKKILINFAHPAKSKSKINMALRRAVENLDNVTINDLYASYPDFMIDVKREQQLCEEHDVIIFQYPFYWYQAPSIVKEWFDLVLEHDWAYGINGNALKGKLLVQVITAGGDASSYQENGVNCFSFNELCSPYRASAKICKMDWIPPFTVLGIHQGLPEDQVRYYAENYRDFIVALREDLVDLEKAKSVTYCSTKLDAIMRRN